MTEDRIARAREALVRLKPPLRVEAFNEVLCGDENCSAMIVRDEDPSCAAIIAQNLTDQDAHDIVALINALTLPTGDAVDEQWQPIETAPKDGTRILLWTSTRITESDIQYVETICEGEHLDCAQIGQWDWPCNAPMRQHQGEWSKQIIGEPTHWQPLPAPPLAAAIRKEPS
jgi:hypothetical protein